MAFQALQTLRDNIAAIRIALAYQPGSPLSEDDIATLRSYAGFGGLKAILFPAGDRKEWEKRNASKADLQLYPSMMVLHQLLRDHHTALIISHKAISKTIPEKGNKQRHMNNSIHSINKGINKSIEFRGLRAQYIWYFAGLVLGLMIVFAALYILGTESLICLTVCGSAAAFGSIKIFALSRKYGEYGLMKAMARNRVPRVLKSYGRRFFQQLNYKEKSHDKA